MTMGTQTMDLGLHRDRIHSSTTVSRLTLVELTLILKEKHFRHLKETQSQAGHQTKENSERVEISW